MIERSRDREPGRGARAGRREERVGEGLAELGRWLRDQIRQGIAGAPREPRSHWEAIARRMVDAQAPAVARRLSGLASVVHREDWPSRLLEEYALLHLMSVACERRAHLPGALPRTLDAHLGVPVPRGEVLAGEPVRDVWTVLGLRDVESAGLVTRRAWLLGRATGRKALVLSHAPPGHPLDDSLRTCEDVHAALVFHPAAPPLRALVATGPGRGPDGAARGPADTGPADTGPADTGPAGDGAARDGDGGLDEGAAGGAPAGTWVAELLDEHARAMAGDPWLEAWPAVLSGVTPVDDGGWHLADPRGDALPVHGPPPWRLVAVSGGHPLTVAGEWTPDGFHPLSAWTPGEAVPL
ncbi:SWIM zinc finger family protein [Bailinhaonella thermotolerans]|uniref:SWIM zinc finger family protein n=1 Tax=Bailinhaonella thermotolerans TaxID=1070861 RepID=A0A3A4AV75_9ACTN|nr:SWIM zinc finger family protein [Bailinhaonella thermotolerans]RJL34130.1 SWIM zinc finger family protein [Bailinhaonella thermotolerans]